MERTGSGDDTKVGEGSDSPTDKFLGSKDLDSMSSETESTAETVIEVSNSGTPKQSSVVTARGTADGLIIRLDGRVESDSLRGALNDFLTDRKAFISGQSVCLEWIGAEPENSTLSLITEDLKINYSIKVKSSEVRMVAVSRPAGSKPHGSAAASDLEGQRSSTDRKTGLFGGIDSFDMGSDQPTKARSDLRDRIAGGTDRSRNSAAESRASYGADKPAALNQSRNYDPTLWDDADTRLVCKTLRSGQKIETEHSLLVVGDVNSGAELVAGGDIIVLGALRGVAHAGAFDETGGGRFIFAVDLEPTQLRIGSIISRGAQSDSTFKAGNGGGPEIARVDGNIIIVEPYSARTVTSLRR